MYVRCVCGNISFLNNQVNRKIKKAFCPPQVVENNPVLDYCKHIIFGYYNKMDITVNGVSALLLPLQRFLN